MHVNALVAAAGRLCRSWCSNNKYSNQWRTQGWLQLRIHNDIIDRCFNRLWFWNYSV